MAVITRITLEGGNIVLRSSAGVILLCIPSQNACLSLCATSADVLYLSDQITERNPYAFKTPISASQVTEPAGPWTREALTAKLSAEYIGFAPASSSGGANPNAKPVPRSFGRGATSVTLPSSGTRYAVLALKPGGAAKLYINSLSIMASTNNNLLWGLLYNPTVTGLAAADYAAVQGSTALGAVLDNTHTVTGVPIAASAGYTAKNTVGDTSPSVPLELSGSNFAVLAVTPLANNLTVYAALNFAEL